jgi:hypothetical protein
MLTIAPSQTTIVRNTKPVWKIVHIHWESRKADAKH